MKNRGTLALLSTMLIFTSCQTNTQTGILAGGAAGAGIGAIAGGGQGALIGGAVGVIGGALVGSALDSQERANMNQQSPQTLNKIDNNQQLSLDDIKKMSKAGLSDDSIISMIKKTNSKYHLTTDDVRDLEKAHVSSAVINYMIST